MYQTDLEEAKASEQSPKSLFGNLRAACESGWDFSSRWLENRQPRYNKYPRNHSNRFKLFVI